MNNPVSTHTSQIPVSTRPALGFLWVHYNQFFKSYIPKHRRCLRMKQLIQMIWITGSRVKTHINTVLFPHFATQSFMLLIRAFNSDTDTWLFYSHYGCFRSQHSHLGWITLSLQGYICLCHCPSLCLILLVACPFFLPVPRCVLWSGPYFLFISLRRVPRLEREIQEIKQMLSG